MLRWAVALCVVGCHASETSPSVPTPQDTSGCAPGELTLEDGSCQPAGVPEGECGEGFVAEAGGCKPILPPESCPDGMMAVPGDAACREVAMCEDVAIEPSAVFVDAAYTGNDSDGSASKPYVTLSSALPKATSQVVLAPGVYLEDVSVWSPVKIWGTCPREVEVGTIAIHAAGTEVHAVALRGVTVAGVRDVVLDKLWIHDAPDRGVEASELGGSASATLRDSLVEGATGLAAFVYGSDMLIERSQLRETRDYPAAYVSLGVGALDSSESGLPSHLEIRRSVVETSPATGVFAYGSELVVETSVVRDIRPDVAGSTGMGIFVQRDPMTGTPAKGSILSSVIERTFTVGFQVVGAEADMRFSSVRDTEWAQDPSLGRGAFVAGDDVQRASVHVYGALFERHRDVGIYVNAGDLALEGVIARDTHANMDGQLGVGVGVDVTTSRGALAMKGSVVERNETGGIYVSGADAVIESSVVRDSLLEPLTGEFGRGIQVQAKWSTGERANVTVRDALIERNREVGIFVGASDVTVERSVIRDTVASDAGLFGDGIAVLGQDAATSANVSETRIENSARAGILAYSGKVSLGASVLECNPIHLDGETVTTPYEFVVTSENVCGCKGETVTCKVLSSMLAPPAPLDH